MAESGENVNPPLVVVQTRLKELGCEFGSGQDWQCPAHDDLKASLGVKASVDGKVLLNCQAGCTTEEVVKALKLEWTDLFPKKRPEVAYTYTDEENRLLFQVVKTSKGDRYARRPADAFAFSAFGETVGEWVNNLNGTRRVLFRLPQIIAAVKRGETIYVAEGEKDVVNLVKLTRVEATCNPFGAGAWKDAYSEVLRGANVVVVADRDEQGYTHARNVAQSLAGIAVSVRIVQPAIEKHKADASDHLEAGLGLDDFVPLDGDQEDDEPLADLEDFLDGDEPEYDWVVPGLIEQTDRVIFTGDEGAGKSVLRRQVAVCVAAGTELKSDLARALGTMDILDYWNWARVWWVNTNRNFRILIYPFEVGPGILPNYFLVLLVTPFLSEDEQTFDSWAYGIYKRELYDVVGKFGGQRLPIDLMLTRPYETPDFRRYTENDFQID